MAELKLDPTYGPLVEEFAARPRFLHINLSPEADLLLRLCLETWFKNPPRLTIHAPDDNGEMKLLANVVLEKALQERHVAREARRPGGVSFYSLLWALASTGRKVLGGTVDKGL